MVTPIDWSKPTGIPEKFPPYSYSALHSASAVQSQVTPGSPQNIIVACADLLSKFRRDIKSFIHEDDFQEVINQVIDRLLNDDDSIDGINELPDFNRMRKDPQFANPCRVIYIQQLVVTFALDLRLRLKQLGTYHGTSFNYVFECFLGDDIVVTLLPY